MDLEKVKVVVDVTNQPGRPRQEEHGPDAAGGKPLDAIGEFIMDVGRGHDGNVALGFRRLSESIEDCALPLLQESLVAFPIPLAVAFPRFLGESGSHSKPTDYWSSEDVF
jgi:hypothetical protein